MDKKSDRFRLPPFRALSLLLLQTVDNMRQPPHIHPHTAQVSWLCGSHNSLTTSFEDVSISLWYCSKSASVSLLRLIGLASCVSCCCSWRGATYVSHAGIYVKAKVLSLLSLELFAFAIFLMWHETSGAVRWYMGECGTVTGNPALFSPTENAESQVIGVFCHGTSLFKTGVLRPTLCTISSVRKVIGCAPQSPLTVKQESNKSQREY